MKLSDLKKSGHVPSLAASFLYFDVSFMIWVILGALGVYITKDFGLTPSQKVLLLQFQIPKRIVFPTHPWRLTDRMVQLKRPSWNADYHYSTCLGGWLFGQTLTELYMIGFLLWGCRCKLCCSQSHGQQMVSAAFTRTGNGDCRCW